MIRSSRHGMEGALRRIAHGLPSPLRQKLSRLRKRKAPQLHSLLPLAVPETIHIDPSNACNFRCVFCPTADPDLLASVGRPKGHMSPDLFVKIIDDLKAMVVRHNQPLSILHLYKDGEPLLNRHFPEMASYAKQARVADLVSTTTNGSILTEATARKVIESKIDQVRISIIHLNPERYRELTETWGDYEKIRSNVRFLFEEKKRARSGLQVVVKTNDTGLSPADIQKFEEDFGKIADAVKIDTLMGWSMSEVKDFTLGKAVETGMDSVSPLRDRKVCPEPFSRLAINFDGQVSVCCVDWSYGTIVGDLRKESLDEIWNGERLREFRLTHLRGERNKIPACAQCQYVKGAPWSRDLDEHAGRLLGIYEIPGDS